MTSFEIVDLDSGPVNSDSWAFWPVPPFTYALGTRPARLVIALWIPVPGLNAPTYAVLSTGEQVPVSTSGELHAYQRPV